MNNDKRIKAIRNCGDCGVTDKDCADLSDGTAQQIIALVTEQQWISVLPEFIAAKKEIDQHHELGSTIEKLNDCQRPRYCILLEELVLALTPPQEGNDE
jgi:hypothetical protein